MNQPPNIDLFEALNTSRSLRRLKPDPIPDDIIRQVIEAGTKAPSGSNQQNWRFLAVTDPEKRAALAELYRKGADIVGLRNYGDEGAPGGGGDDRAQRLTANSVKYLIDHIQDPPLLLLLCAVPLPAPEPPPGYEPPANVLKFMERSEPAGILLAVQNIMLACRAFGLATCPTTLHLVHEDEVKDLLGIPEGAKTFMMLPIGYPNDKIGPVRRYPVEDVTFRDTWGVSWPG
ncbi:MAG: nitroreductase family protein [Gammaproteobacteria bacterium]|nr:nitroreductase family protein [Gammaproteobacteria bacterium]